MSVVPAIRVQDCNAAPIRADGEFVLYWMIAFRRTTWNFSLQRALEWAKLLQKPLVLFEPLRIGYRWASDRLHRFVLDGMADNLRQLGPLKPRGVFYYPYVEPDADRGKGLLAALASRACVVVTDDYPSFFLPRMVQSAARRLEIRLEKVDSNGLLPLRAADRIFTTARAFRNFLHKQVPVLLQAFPQADPLGSIELPVLSCLPESVQRRWPPASAALIAADSPLLTRLPIDHSVVPVDYRGGFAAARTLLKQFLTNKLVRYGDGANQPEEDCRSGFSPYLHFGHLSVHEIFSEIVRQQEWTPEALCIEAVGKREGFWGMSAAVEAFLDQLVIWRELGYNMSFKQDNYDRFESLPEWAKATLLKHASDPRPYIFLPEQLESARTHDPLWNAAQTQLVREGRIHNYLRMLWGKKILEWSIGPHEALETMIELNNKYGVDGRDPNSYSGIFWILGRYDRPWGPERPIFGVVRYMSSRSAAKKLRLQKYLDKYSRN